MKTIGLVLGVVGLLAMSASAEQAGPTVTPAAQVVGPPGTPAISTPPDYVIGPDDVIAIDVLVPGEGGAPIQREPLMSGEVVIRPDGKFSLPLLREIDAAGLTPDQLLSKVEELAKKYTTAPIVSVVVRKVNSRNVFVTGEVRKPGSYPLMTKTNLLQMLVIAGGLTEYADKGNIAVIRTKKDGSNSTIKANYNDIRNGKKPNIELQVGDIIDVGD